MPTTQYYPGAGDGWIESGWKASWSAARGATTGTADYTTVKDSDTITCAKSGSSFRVDRAFYPIDTTSLPPGAVITSATFHFKNYVNTGSFASGQGVALVVSTQASTSSLIGDDFDNISFESKGTYTGTAPGADGWVSITLTDTSIINKGGWTKLAIIGTRDLNNVEPSSWDISLGSYFSENSGTSSDPYLEVTYSTSSTSAFFQLF